MAVYVGPKRGKFEFASFFDGFQPMRTMNERGEITQAYVRADGRRWPNLRQTPPDLRGNWNFSHGSYDNLNLNRYSLYSLPPYVLYVLQTQLAPLGDRNLH